MKAKCLRKPAANFPDSCRPSATERTVWRLWRRARRSSLAHQLEHEFHVLQALISPAWVALSITYSQTRHYVQNRSLCTTVETPKMSNILKSTVVTCLSCGAIFIKNFIGPIANLKGPYFQPSLSVGPIANLKGPYCYPRVSVCLCVCVSLTGTSTLQR